MNGVQTLLIDLLPSQSSSITACVSFIIARFINNLDYFVSE